MMMHGVCAVYKPRGMTSAKTVAIIKRILRTHQKEALAAAQQPPNAENEHTSAPPKRLKVGHGGTLDRLAEGVLVIGVGHGCKHLKHFLGGTKEYVVTAELGKETDTYDMDGAVTARSPFQHISLAQTLSALHQFRGQFMQTPPLFSALKIHGKRLSDYTRAGVHVEPRARLVHVTQLDLCYFAPPEVTLHIACKSGLYVRSLVHDLGTALDSHASVTTLIRTRVNNFGLLDALQPDNWTPQHFERAFRRYPLSFAKD
ncbi:hypothetical protein PTSG_11173 [Salpingoeca rosetta]|uniref:tRNA pseudouridine(55) synthase n=1 Tax=Salpingoeca rosetta (strain ATCC 50818 / BSB-021) TaxID=946362 RepID=F2USM6_SALR5|nr:uncharacterized protein PTSG_11173 [Salpingoeca rosetta]EGD81135.1 hypothetical protein PTSG_11173 [Salpingoeca rosetta]|eukprot:XP_004987820.1 hypothetical protein PTSG_11173 [Salpingoeca rosetta]